MSVRSLSQDFLRALGGSTGIYVFGAAMAFFVGVQLARGLGVAGYGLYGSAMAAASLGANVAAGGLQTHATRDLSAYLAQGDEAGAARLVAWSFRHVLALGAAAALAAGAYVIWGLNGPPALAYATMLTTALIAMVMLVGAIVRGAGQLVLGQALDNAIRPAAQAALLWIAILALGVIEPGLAMALTCVAILFTLPFGWRAVSHLWRVPQKGAGDAAERQGWGKASVTMGLSTIINAAETTLPLLMVGALTTIEEAGLFRVSTAIMVFSNLPATMMMVMTPAMASSLYHKGDAAQLRRLSLAAAAVMLLPTVGIAGCLWIFGENLLALAFGNDYRAAWPIMCILTEASVIGSMGGISISLLHAARSDAVVTRACAVSLAVTVIGLVFAAFDGRATTFAVAVLAGTLARMLYLVWSTRRNVGIDPTILAILGALAGWRRRIR